MKKLSLDELNRITVQEFKQAPKHPIVVVLDNIRSMNNVGSFFRTGDAFRIEKIYLCGFTPTPPHREISRSALGAELAVDWEKAEDTTSVLHFLKKNGYQIMAVEQAEGSIELERFEWDTDQPLAIIFGNEVTGVDDKVMALVDGSLEISQYGTKHSLNVAVSGGIVLWQLLIQYQKKNNTQELK